MKPSLRALAFGCLVLYPSVGFAQAARIGKTFAMGGTPLVVTPDAAYDSVSNRYLVVHGHGFIEALLTDAAGTVLTRVVVNASRGTFAGEYAQDPRVAYGRDVNGGGGGYLVTWHESVGPVAQVRGRILDVNANPLTGDFVISTDAALPGTGSFWTQGAAIAYSTASRSFLVAWMGHYTTTNDVYYMPVSIGGAVLQALPTRVTAGTADWERDPSVAYNPDADEFYVVYAGFWDALRYSYVSGVRVKASTGAIAGRSPEFTQTAATYIPAVDYNTATKQYTVAWYHRSTSSAVFMGLNVNQDGTPASPIRLLSPYYQAYDALDLKYNPSSGDFLLVTHGNNPEPWEDAAVLIKSDGTPYDNGFVVTHTLDVRPLKANPSANDGNFNPRLAVNPTNGTWLAATSSLFASVNGQFVKSASTVAPPPPTPNPQMAIDTPGNGVLQQPFLIAGWAADLGSPSTSGADAVHVWAWPTSGATPIFVGAVTPDGSRSDVAKVFGSRFGTSGYSMIVNNLPGGSYLLAAYMHSTVAGKFNFVRMVSVTIAGPLLSIDFPSANAQVSSAGFTIGGWAIDRGAASGPGVNTLHVWAFPAGGGAPKFAGVATYGIARPDVGAVFGAQFTYSGYNVMIDKDVLSPGEYDVRVYGQSAVTGTFNVVQVVHVFVQ